MLKSHSTFLLRFQVRNRSITTLFSLFLKPKTKKLKKFQHLAWFCILRFFFNLKTANKQVFSFQKNEKLKTEMVIKEALNMSFSFDTKDIEGGQTTSDVMINALNY